MRKIFNLILILFIIGLSVVLIMPSKDLNRESDVYVEHEWDKLDTAILGSPKMLTVQAYHKNLELVNKFAPEDKAFIVKNGGKPVSQIDPYLYSQVVEQYDNLANLLKEKGVTIIRMNPEVLSVEELRFMKDVQQGQNFLFSRNPVIVIGNNVIETSSRTPISIKHNFIVRKIFRSILKENPSIHYAATPSVSPAFPEKGIYLEGSDVIVDGYNVYVGYSGGATSVSGIKWLKKYLGPKYKVHMIEIRNFEHLDEVLVLIKPGLGLIVRSSIVGDLPKPLRKWEFIDILEPDAKNFATNIIVLGHNQVLVDERFEGLINQLRTRNIDVTPVPFEAVSQFGGGLRSAYNPIKRVYDIEANTKKINAQYFKDLFFDCIDNIKSYDYKQVFEDTKTKIMGIFQR